MATGPELGNSGTITFDSNTVANVQSYSLSRSGSFVEAPILGNPSYGKAAPEGSAECSVECLLDISDTAQEAMTIGASATVVLNPFGTASGSPTRTFTADVVSIEEGPVTGANEFVKRNFTLRSSTVPVNGTIA